MSVSRASTRYTTSSAILDRVLSYYWADPSAISCVLVRSCASVSVLTSDSFLALGCSGNRSQQYCHRKKIEKHLKRFCLRVKGFKELCCLSCSKFLNAAKRSKHWNNSAYSLNSHVLWNHICHKSIYLSIHPVIFIQEQTSYRNAYRKIWW